MKNTKFLLIVPLALGITACSDDSDDDNKNNELTVPTTYSFASVFVDGADSVAYDGQTMRHVLISDLTSRIKSLTESDSPGEVISAMDFFFRFDDGVGGDLPYSFTVRDANDDPVSLAQGPNYEDISTGKNLVGKIAGRDPALINGEFFGGTQGMDSNPTPEELADYFFAQLDAIATDDNTDQIDITGGSAFIDKPYISVTGLDYSQLIQKFLLGAVAFSQGVGDYLATDYSADNSDPRDGESYSDLQHLWDEAFGYFGAARDYNDYTDDELSGASGRVEYANGYHDSNGDGNIDLYAEYNFGNSANCAKRDRASVDATNFTKEAFDAFLKGRAILNEGVTLSGEKLDEFNEARLTASVTWEKCIAATVIHYINKVVADIDAFDGDVYADLDAFKAHAKHWGEMKGFALGLQFNPDSPFRADTASLNNLKQVLSLMGDAPVLPDGTQNGVAFSGGANQYRADLITVRNILRDAYEFSANNAENWGS